MKKFSIKYWQNKFNNVLKRSYDVIKSISFEGYRDGSTYANH
jgi:endo-alpha-1,4-polygalactosaminidase (GH114 family)